MKVKKEIQSVSVDDRCRESVPCRHNVAITYKDGTEKAKLLTSPKIAEKYSAYLGDKKGHFTGYIGLFSKSISKEDRLFEKACTEADSRSMGTQEYLEVFAHKFGISKEEISHSEFLETKVLKNILSKCNTIPQDIDITGQAGWFVHSIDTALDNSLTVVYPTLTLNQRKEVVDAYTKQYGPLAVLSEDYYKGGYCKESINGILFNKAYFCKFILPDLMKQPEKEEQCVNKKQKCG